MGTFILISCTTYTRCAVNIIIFLGLAILAGMILWSCVGKQWARASLIVKHSLVASPFQPRRVLQSCSTFRNRVVDRIVLHPLILRSRTKVKFKITPQSPLLSLELCDTIIFFCSPDRPTLLVCSLVSYAWVPVSRRHLWYSFETAEQMHKFAHLLRSPYETLSHHIRDVYLSVPQMTISSQYRRAFDILERKHAILRVQRVEIDLEESCVQILLKYLMHIESLIVHCGRVVRSRKDEQLELGAVLAKCSTLCNLRHLAIHLQSTRSGDETLDIRIPILVKLYKKMPHLRTLFITGWNTDIIGWLARSCRNLSSMTFESFSPIADIPLFESLLRRNSATLSHLSISTLASAPIDLSSLSELTTLQLYISGPESVGAAARTIETCIGLWRLSTLFIRARHDIDAERFPPIWNSIMLLGKLENPVRHMKMGIKGSTHVYIIPTRAGEDSRLSG